MTAHKHGSLSLRVIGVKSYQNLLWSKLGGSAVPGQWVTPVRIPIPHHANNSYTDPSWRHMKQKCCHRKPQRQD
jgi:hypothetical protein